MWLVAVLRSHKSALQHSCNNKLTKSASLERLQ